MKKRVFYLKNLQSYENRKFTSNVLQKLKSSYNVSLLLLKIEHSFFQESIDNNKSIGQRRRRALLGHNVKHPGDLTVIRGRWTPLAYPRVTDAVF